MNIIRPSNSPWASAFNMVKKSNGLVKAYHLIPMKDFNIPKTAICTAFGTFEYLLMPLGLRNASSTFHRFVDNIFRDFEYVVTYMENILVYSSSEEEHLKHLDAVLRKLNQVSKLNEGLKVNDSKSFLCRSEVNFLG